MTLRKLPLWGSDEWNFEWPTHEDFMQMGPDVSVTSVEFKTDNSKKFLTSVKVNYSNGESSPTFEMAES